MKVHGEITIKTTNKYTLITIENYGIYQSSKEQINQDINQQITNQQPTNNQQITNNQPQYNKDNNNKNSKENNKNNSSSGSDKVSDDLQKIIDFYNNNIGMITSYGLEVLADYAREMPIDLIIYAMKIAVEANKRTIQYIKGILNNWNRKGIKNLVEAKQENQRYSKNKKNENKNSTANTDWGKMYDDLIKKEGG